MTVQNSRRRFLKTGCLTAAAVGLTVCGGGAVAATYQPKIDLPNLSYGDPASPRRLLIAYASKAGSTAEIAARMGEQISSQAARVDVMPVTQVTSLSGYQAVILGSAIRMSSPLPEVVDFVKANQEALRQLPFSVFIACMTLKEDTPENRLIVSDYLVPLRAIVKPVNEGLFAGKIDMNKLKGFERLIILGMKSPQGDFRRWDLINAWAASLSAS